ncbi:MAG: hypothetical protein K2M95_00295, partial [Clostridiales bacterium]|nr:hypothetical protein [Clostridiales bacterium]
MLMVLMVSLAVGGVGILGVDFAANASSKAIKEDISLSAAPDDANPSYAISINSSNQYEYTFAAKGAIQSITLPAGKYKLELWGAQGATGSYNIPGGKGGYTYGTLEITSAKTLYVAVGGQGTRVGTTTTATGGGWNGGGNGKGVSMTGGGGASHIATALRSTGVLSAYNSYRTEILMVAGGGGGGAYSAEPYAGGGGGGLSGGQAGSNGGYLNGVEAPSTRYYGYCHGLGATTTTYGSHVNSSGSHGDTASYGPCTNG